MVTKSKQIEQFSLTQSQHDTTRISLHSVVYKLHRLLVFTKLLQCDSAILLTVLSVFCMQSKKSKPIAVFHNKVEKVGA